MEKLPLAGKVALVTGAARRIGAEIARTLHEQGMNIVIHYNHSQNEANQLAQELNNARAQSAHPFQADLAASGASKPLIAKSVELWGRLDAVVNNASRFYRTDINEITEFAWEDLMNSNARGPFFLAQAAAVELKKNAGCIVNITDVHAESPMRDYSIYSISKAALFMATKVLARELGPRVRVNGVAPGAVMWPEGENLLSEQQKSKIIGQTALERAGTAGDIAKVVLFLVRDADYVTGQVINVDGGRSI